ncbi:MAG: 1,4-dihydroxy-2-naphthoyl-CoA hydrolase [Firmicutes bacterium ADurb.Bin419]|nr:MAG: 1,4-dihydroxy-2-naphthoyl-CoA hydrolase [Firmicutes bacterium ADurb.Bin419]
MVTKTCFHVKFTEVDGMGIVHHSNYPLWFEKGRRDYLRKAQASDSQITKRGLFLPLSEIECKYKSPAKKGDKIVVITKITSMSSVRIKFEYEILDKEKGRLLATGRTVHVWTNQKIEPINIVKTASDVYLQLKQFSESQDAT